MEMRILGFWTFSLVLQLAVSDWSSYAVVDHSSTTDSAERYAGVTRWSGWSQCSRQCNVGVTRNNGTCSGGGDGDDGAGTCQPLVKYKTCNEQPCHQKSVNFRDHQCSKYNKDGKRGREEWISFYNSNDPCWLFCRKVGSAVVQKKGKVVDGTACLNDNGGICLNGHCWISDCKSRSSAVSQKECVICGEGGELCGRYTWHVGHLSPCSVTCGKGTRISPVMCRDTLLEKPVDDSHCQHQPRPLAKHKSCHKGPCKPSWVRGVWSLCSVTCGSGILVRDVYCAFKLSPSYKKVADRYCGRRRPRDVHSCNKPTCPSWNVGPWSKCSSRCTIGIQNRTVECEGTAGLPCSALDAPITTQPCHNEGRCAAGDTQEDPPPEKGIGDIYDTMQSDFGRTTAKPRWKLLVKGPCSVSCGSGIRALTFQCQTYNYKSRSYQALSDLKCLGVSARPPELEQCHRSTCYRPGGGNGYRPYHNPVTYLWRYTGYGPCSAPCLGGTKRARVECVSDSDRRPVSKLMCDPTSQPKDLVVPCNLISCAPTWRIGNWTACSATCGRGIETRSVDCIQVYGRKATQFILHPAYRCASIPPVKTKFCGTSDCPPKWYAGEWSSCTPLCGGLKMRQVECRMRNSNGSMVTLHGRNELSCTDTRPDAWAPCGEEDCRQPAPEPTRRSNQPEIRSDNSRFVQTKRRRKVKLVVGGVSTIIPGTRLIIRCPVRHARRKDIVWSKVGKGRILGVGRVRTSRKGLLRIHRARPTDAGTYTCRAGKLEANWTLLFHSANEGATLFDPRKRYLNQRAERKTAKSFPDAEKQFVLSDAVRHAPKNHSLTPYDFVVGRWSPCSVTCDGKGVTKRSVTCEVIQEDYFKVVEDRLCTDHGLTRPLSEKMCEAMECPKWNVGHWSRNCVSKCKRAEFGTQYRNRVCSYRNGTAVTTAQCPQHDSPDTERACQNKLCRATWKVSTFSKCSVTCGGSGVRTRMLRCVWKGTNKSAGRLCINLPRPSLIRRCYSPPCTDVCRDSSSYCSLTKRLKLCRHRAYKKLCCATCSS